MSASGHLIMSAFKNILFFGVVLKCLSPLINFLRRSYASTIKKCLPSLMFGINEDRWIMCPPLREFFK